VDSTATTHSLFRGFPRPGFQFTAVPAPVNAEVGVRSGPALPRWIDQRRNDRRPFAKHSLTSQRGLTIRTSTKTAELQSVRSLKSASEPSPQDSGIGESANRFRAAANRRRRPAGEVFFFLSCFFLFFFSFLPLVCQSATSRHRGLLPPPEYRVQHHHSPSFREPKGFPYPRPRDSGPALFRGRMRVQPGTNYLFNFWLPVIDASSTRKSDVRELTTQKLPTWGSSFLLRLGR